MVTHIQGGRIFEILWEPNFPLNNFARNNGKIIHHPHNNQRKIVTNDKTRQNTQSRDQFADGPCPVWTVRDKDQTRVFFKTL